MTDDHPPRRTAQAQYEAYADRLRYEEYVTRTAILAAERARYMAESDDFHDPTVTYVPGLLGANVRHIPIKATDVHDLGQFVEQKHSEIELIREDAAEAGVHL